MTCHPAVYHKFRIKEDAGFVLQGDSLRTSETLCGHGRGSTTYSIPPFNFSLNSRPSNLIRLLRAIWATMLNWMERGGTHIEALD